MEVYEDDIREEAEGNEESNEKLDRKGMKS